MRGLKLQVGIGSLGELEYYLAEGADELYCGLYSIPNHVEGARNFSTPAEVLTAGELARAAGRKLFFAANEVHRELLGRTVGTIKELVDGGIDGIIIKDLALLDALRKKKVRTHYILSTLSYCMNAETLAFYAGYGIKRVALPEQLWPEEAGELLRNRHGIKAEVFLKHRESCINYNGLCFLDCHGGRTTFCKRPFRIGKAEYRMAGPGAAEQLAELYEYHRLGASVLKVGRSPVKEASRLIFREARQLAELLGRGLPKKEFLARALRVKTGFDALYGYLGKNI
jgi:collagenase-like PrtC family protease